jgi:hypothetical protein
MSNSKFTHGPDGKTRRKKGPKLPKFVPLFWYVIDSPVWRDLSGDEVKAFIFVARRYNGANNGTIAVPARELADAMGCCKSTASTLLRNLVARGFLEVVTRSAFSLKNKRAAEYRLTTHHCDKTGKPASWTPEQWRAVAGARPQVAQKSISRCSSLCTHGAAACAP